MLCMDKKKELKQREKERVGGGRKERKWNRMAGKSERERERGAEAKNISRKIETKKTDWEKEKMVSDKEIIKGTISKNQLKWKRK